MNSGFPTSDALTAPCHARYVGMYYYSAYWRTWDKVLGVKDGVWTVQEVDRHGNPVGEVRTHRTPLWANRFADQPF